MVVAYAAIRGSTLPFFYRACEGYENILSFIAAELGDGWRVYGSENVEAGIRRFPSNEMSFLVQESRAVFDMYEISPQRLLDMLERRHGESYAAAAAQVALDTLRDPLLRPADDRAIPTAIADFIVELTEATWLTQFDTRFGPELRGGSSSNLGRNGRWQTIVHARGHEHAEGPGTFCPVFENATEVFPREYVLGTTTAQENIREAARRARVSPTGFYIIPLCVLLRQRDAERPWRTPATAEASYRMRHNALVIDSRASAAFLVDPYDPIWVVGATERFLHLPLQIEEVATFDEPPSY